MVMFMAHIAVILEIMALAAGLITLHFAVKFHSKLIKTAGILLIVFGVGGYICTVYYAVQYFFMGHYEHSYGLNINMEGKGPHINSSPGE